MYFVIIFYLFIFESYIEVFLNIMEILLIWFYALLKIGVLATWLNLIQARYNTISSRDESIEIFQIFPLNQTPLNFVIRYQCWVSVGSVSLEIAIFKPSTSLYCNKSSELFANLFSPMISWDWH